jgi:polyvinyl alcohol dehydrogenase (cytochrome)
LWLAVERIRTACADASCAKTKERAIARQPGPAPHRAAAVSDGSSYAMRDGGDDDGWNKHREGGATMTITMAARSRALAALILSLAVPIAGAADGEAIYREHCAQCHDGAIAQAPDVAELRALGPAAIAASLESGTMRFVGAALDEAGRRSVAEYLGGTDWQAGAGQAAGAGAHCATSPPLPPDSLERPHWNGWGVDSANSRFQPAAMAGLSLEQVPTLALRWAFGFPGETITVGQPTVVGARVFVGTRSGIVYALDAATGCIHWTFRAGGMVRTAVTVGRLGSGEAAVFAAYFVDTGGKAHAIDADTGRLIWATPIEDGPSVRVTGAPQLHAGRLYVPASTTEVYQAGDPGYRCCTARGSVTALDAATGAIVWKTYTVREPAAPSVVNAAGKQLWGPSGAGVWSAPTIDPKQGVLYVGTGDNNSDPPTDTSDAIIAMDLATGAIRWVYQGTGKDAWNTGCLSDERVNCPREEGPDVDFAGSPVLIALAPDRRVLIGAQKSGVVHALDPDRAGRLLWQVRVGQGGFYGGGVMWGGAADADTFYAPVSEVRATRRPTQDESLEFDLDPRAGGGLYALRIGDGAQRWYAPPARCGDWPGCSPAQSAAATVIPGVVFSGAYDGHLRAYATDTGRVIWDYDTVRPYETVNGVEAHGGALDGPGPTVVAGVLYVNSGYGRFSARPGNVLLAFAPAAQ